MYVLFKIKQPAIYPLRSRRPGVESALSSLVQVFVSITEIGRRDQSYRRSLRPAFSNRAFIRFNNMQALTYDMLFAQLSICVW